MAKIETTEARTIKAGDLVRVLRLPSPDWACGYYSVGMAFIVDSVADGRATGERGQLVYGTAGSYMRTEDVELVELAASQAEQKEPVRRFAQEGMRVRCTQGDYSGMLGTVTHVRVFGNNCRVEFDGHPGCGVTYGLELGECLDDLLDEQARKLSQLPVTMAALSGAKVDPYEEHRKELVAKLTRNGFQPHPDKKHGATLDHYAAMSMEREDTTADKWKPGSRPPREVLIANLARELDRPAPVRFPHEGRSDRAMPRSNGR